MDDTKVLSRRTSPGHGGAGEVVEKAPEGNTSVAEDIGEATPMATDDGDNQQSGPQPDTLPETYVAPGSGEQPPSKEGASAPSVTSTNPEAPNTLVEALQRASIMEEHHTLMGAVVEKVQSANRELIEAFTSLLTGFKVCCGCQNWRISGRGPRTVRLRRMVTGGGGHDVYPGSGPLDGGNTLRPA